jgi:hypothetical protein
MASDPSTCGDERGIYAWEVDDCIIKLDDIAGEDKYQHDQVSFHSPAIAYHRGT